MTAYYNEFCPKAAAWLRQLITNGDIADGIVDERSITDVEAADLKGFTQHHFFAGIGVWSYSLRNAGWSDDRPVCTASLPCQPFSAAGNQKGKDDERHLLPHFLELVGQCNFHTIIGEQVEAAMSAKHTWLDDLYTEMENQNYAVGAAVIGAHSFGKPHIRKRIYWVAHSINEGSQRRVSGRQDSERENINRHTGCGSTDSRLAHSESVGWKERPDQRGAERERGEGIETGREVRTEPGDSSASSIGTTHSNSLGQSRQGIVGRPMYSTPCEDGEIHRVVDDGIGGRMGNTEHNGLTTNQGGRGAGESKENSRVCESEGSSAGIDWLYCRDEKYRPIKSGIKPLVDGVARGMVYSSDSVITPNASAEARTIRLKGYGNAIVAPVAEAFIRATMEVIDGVKTL